MAYRESLGRVKGDTGQIYIPSIKEENNNRYIEWTLADEPPADVNRIDITPKVYLPSIDENGNISFILTNVMPASINSVNIKGDKGDPGEVNTTVVSTLPAKADAQEGIVYIHDGDAFVFDKEENEFYLLDNLANFDNYYTKDESDETFYSKTQIDNMFGNIAACQEAIIYTLDKNSVNIPSGD